MLSKNIKDMNIITVATTTILKHPVMNAVIEVIPIYVNNQSKGLNIVLPNVTV